MNNDPAFPISDQHRKDDFTGLTMLDYFAAKAMQAAFGCERIVEIAAKHGADQGSEKADFIARFAYEMADAMLKEKANREKQP